MAMQVFTYFFFCCLLIAEVFGAFTPSLVPFCTDIDGKFTQAAVACQDVADESYCGAYSAVHLYRPDTTFQKARLGAPAISRIVQCYSGVDAALTLTALPDPSYVFAAVATCAKTCGFCCMTPEFSCRNPANAAINCETVTAAMCRDSKWRQLIATNCPNKCGFCLEGNCIDAAVDCDKDTNICYNPALATFAKESCKRTCGYCDGLLNGSCIDTLSNCTSLVSKGFCASTDYNGEEKKKLCGKSCGLC